MPDTSDKLRRYREKRHRKRTPEPMGDRAKSRRKAPRFVIQAHDATRLHYDFRLEIDGVLVSWAVPKGPSTDPREKRLAVRTEDHPLDYADFEGVIPANEYGGGTVIVWDTGPYRNLKRDDDGNPVPVAQCLENGQIEVWLEGEKLQGGYALVHTRMGRKQEENWLLVKMNDEGADARRRPTSTQRESVLSGRTLEDVAAEEGDAADDAQ